jgi:hypothetical protein
MAILDKAGSDKRAKRDQPGPSKVIRIIFSAKPLTAVNPSHCADESITLVRLSAPILLLPVFKAAILVKVEPGIFDGIGFFACDHVSPLNHERPRR